MYKMKLLINYSNNVFRKSQKLNSKTGKEVALFDEVISYSPKDIEQDFFEKNKKILSQKKGNGYWLWKPYFIKRSLERLNYDDFLFYCDAGSYFINPITPLINISLETGQDIITFELSQIERVYTKRDAFILMECENSKYTETKQRLASYNLWKKSKLSMDFINEWLRYAQDERIITDIENQCGFPNYPEFKEHRWDQSIFSLLTKKYNLDAYRDPSQWGNESLELYKNSTYEQLIEHTRKRNLFYPSKLLDYLNYIKSTKVNK